jgi:hypothetical protein
MLKLFNIFEVKYVKTLFFLAFLFLVFVFFINYQYLRADQQFSLLADSFLNGKLSFEHYEYDSVFFEGRAYWPLGPLPALIIVPFKAIANMLKANFYQSYLHIIFVLGIAYLCYSIARKNSYSNNDAGWLSFAFCACSAFIGIAFLPSSWHFAQSLTVLLLFSALHEFFFKKRYWLIGVFFAMIFATRFSAWPGIIFFCITIIQEKGGYAISIKKYLALFLPTFLSVLLIFLYNYVRFHNPFESGYDFQVLSHNSLDMARSYGLFNVVHIPGNLYYFLLSFPEPIFRDGVSHVLKFPYVKINPWGMSIFATSPYFAYLFLGKYKNSLTRTLWVPIILISAIIFSYYGIGFLQFGYRYSLDFLPFLFLIFLLVYREKHSRLTFGMKLLFTLTFASNIYLFMVSFFG